MSNAHIHGGMLDQMRADFPDAPEPWIDLSTGINPTPWPVGTIAASQLHALPTLTAYEACSEAMAHSFGAPAASVLPTAGSELVIRLLPTVLDLHSVAILDPSYGDHVRVWTASGATVIRTDNPLAHAATSDAVILCNPNNPDGRAFDPVDLEAACQKLAARGGWLIIDEAYADLDPAQSMARHGGAEGLIVLRSFGKFFGLPGLRLGAFIAPSKLRMRMSERVGVWNVSGMALHIGAAAYRDRLWQADTRCALQRARGRLDAILNDAGLHALGGTDLFGFVRANDAQALWQRLAETGIYVRRFASMPDCLRIGLPADEVAESRLKEALSL